MAGDIEEPFSISFQAGSIHSGSISFGRFESEPLCWERRSSFSRNRYLEEIEQYSKPGSVTEKKAILEAHFRRRALMRQSSSEAQSGTESQTNESNNSEIASYNKEVEHINEDSHSARSGNSRSWSECHEDSAALDYRREDTVSSASDPPTEAVSNITEVECTARDTRDIHDFDTNQTETEVKELQVVDQGTQIEDIHVIADNTVCVSESSKVTDSPRSEAAEKVDRVDLKHPDKTSKKTSTSRDSNTSKAKSKPQANSRPVQKRNHGDASKDFLKTSMIRDKDASYRKKTEKQSPQVTAPRIRSSSQRNLKLEDLQSSKLSINRDRRSEKDPRSKAINSQSSVLKKNEPKACQNPSRTTNSVSSNKEHIGLTAGAFRFKSDERAEKRKQFLMKMEDKKHVKEAEINQIQARTQEKKNAEIRQFQKSLNFKATPMPSFYHSANGNKTISSTAKPLKGQVGPVSQPNTSTGRLPLHSKAASVTVRPPSRSQERSSTPKQLRPSTPKPSRPSTPKPSRPIGRPATSEGRLRAASLNKSHTPGAVIGTRPNEKKERQSTRDTMHKYTASRSTTETAKSQHFEGKQSMARPRSSGGLVRKHLRGMDLGRSTAMGHLSVGVAS